MRNVLQIFFVLIALTGCQTHRTVVRPFESQGQKDLIDHAAASAVVTGELLDAESYQAASATNRLTVASLPSPTPERLADYRAQGLEGLEAEILKLKSQVTQEREEYEKSLREAIEAEASAREEAERLASVLEAGEKSKSKLQIYYASAGIAISLAGAAVIFFLRMRHAGAWLIGLGAGIGAFGYFITRIPDWIISLSFIGVLAVGGVFAWVAIRDALKRDPSNPRNKTVKAEDV